MRTTAPDTASQMALRNCSKEVRETVSIYVILVRGVHVIRLAFQQKVAASHEEKKRKLLLVMRKRSLHDFSVFLCTGRCRSLGS